MRSYYYAVHIYSCGQKYWQWQIFVFCKICCLRGCGVHSHCFYKYWQWHNLETMWMNLLSYWVLLSSDNQSSSLDILREDSTRIFLYISERPKDQQPRSGFSINKLNFGLFSPNPVIYHQKTWNIWHVLHGIILWYFCIFFQCLVLVAIHCCGMDECVYGIFL